MRASSELRFVSRCVLGVLASMLGTAALQAQHIPNDCAASAVLSKDVLGSIDQFHVIYETVDLLHSVPRERIAVRREIAQQRTGNFLHVSSKSTSRYEHQDDPLRQSLIISGDSSISRKDLDRVVFRSSLGRSDPLPGSAASDFFFAATGWWIDPGRQAPTLDGDAAVVFGDLAKSTKHLVLPPESVGNPSPFVLLKDEGSDLIWIDTRNNGCLIMAREFYDLSTGRLLQRIAVEETKEAGDGLIIPALIRNSIYDYPAGVADAVGRLTVDSRTEILSLDINADVDPRLFELRLLGDSLHVDGSGRISQLGPADGSYMSELVLWCRRIYGFPHAAHPKGGTPLVASLPLEILLYLVCLVLGALLGKAVIGEKAKCSHAITARASRRR